MKILVTGGSGLIGSRYVELSPNLNLLAPSSEELDITSSECVKDYIHDQDINTIINFAGYTNTQKAQVEHEKSRELNVSSVEYLIEACQEFGSKLVQISTDFVFDGKKGNYSEDDLPNPVNYYGQTKLEAENLVKNSEIDWLIVRTAYPYRAKFDSKSDCVRWVLPKLKAGEEVTLVEDQLITPSWIDELAAGLNLILDKKGIWHIAGSECLSIYQMGLRICQVFGFDPKLVKKTTLDQFRVAFGRVESPAKSCLNTDKLKSETGFGFSDFKTCLIKLKSQMEDK